MATKTVTPFITRCASVISTANMAPGLARKYEINADMGEGFGRWKMGPDEELMPLIDAANIAYLFGFGRRKIEVDTGDMYAMILYQVGSLKAMLDAEGVELSHIKPHGELFFYMQRDTAIMRAVLDACATFKVPVYASQNAEQEAMCNELGIPFQGEVYVDIDYSPEGKLLPFAKSRVATPELCSERALSATRTDTGKDINGTQFSFGFGNKPFSICLHSDAPTVLENARAVRKAIDEANRDKFASVGPHL
ncbi:Hypothetical protein NCS54_00902000 [Fusarium falciforme]|uniref:Hypothetical protein n=1 Tax=Fusarium falciforme TaxID=195108 RepID=UPI00230049CE|nr:Hypothetical protein NCS54_00902000 [Fusarium falciforme]WAO91545.1 Hypothetical protein NCS54_00902000 [Fusarium falciforme]